MDAKKIRYAVVGLGHIAQVAVLPAFRHAHKNSVLAAIVTGDPIKAKKLSRKYEVNIACSYDDYGDLLYSGDIDAVYICLPNHLHFDYVMPAVRAGIHVLCEKPLTLSLDNAEMIRHSAHNSNVKVMTAYRLHFEPSNIRALELCRSGEIGSIKYFNSNFSFRIEDPNNIRLKHETGGGPVWDIGIYCINAVRNIFQCEPTDVVAFSTVQDEDLFSEVEETVAVAMKFPGDRVACFTCSFGADTVSEFRVVGDSGSIRLENAYDYATTRQLTMVHDMKSRTVKFKKNDQFAPELVYFSDCIINDEEPEPSALEGMADIRVILAIYESIRSGSVVHLPFADLKRKRPSREMKMNYPGISEPRSIRARSPSS